MPTTQKPVHRHVVRYHETDAQGIVFNARYLELFDVALTEFFRSLGWPYPELVKMGLDPALVRADIEFLRPAAFDDVLEVRAACTRLGRSSFTLSFSITRGDEGELNRANITYVNFDSKTGRSRPIPGDIRDALAALAAAQDGDSTAP